MPGPTAFDTGCRVRAVRTDRAIRVLHVTPYFAPAFVYGGPTRSLPLLCTALQDAGAEVTVLTTNANGATELDVPLSVPQTRDGVTVLYFSRRWGSRRFTSPDLARACRTLARDYDLVHITGLWTQPAAAAAHAARVAGKPYFISPRGMLMRWELRHKSWKKLPYFHLAEAPRLRRAAAIHCTTELERRALEPLGLGARAFTVPNALTLDEFNALPPRGALRARLAIPSDSPVVLFVGRLHPKKGLSELLAAFRCLHQARPAAHLLLVGPDEENTARGVGAWAGNHGLTSSVHLTGELRHDALLQAYRDADVLVHLSHSENFGMSVAEAMAGGLPVVVSRGVGITTWVEKYRAGVVTSVEETAAAAAMAAALDDAAGGGTMAANGRRLITAEFAPEAVGRAMLDAYHRILSGADAAPV